MAASVSPRRRGQNGFFHGKVLKALCGAYVSYLKLEQAHGMMQSTKRIVKQKLQELANGATFDATCQLKRIEKATAGHFVGGTEQKIELRPLQWTTYTNLDMWFDGMKELFISLGFACERTETDTKAGEIVFFQGQKRRVIKFDESALSLDNTDKRKGGRPSSIRNDVTLVAPSTAASKSGSSSTIICGSNGEGEMLLRKDNNCLSILWEG